MLNSYIATVYPPQTWQYIMLVPLISCLLILTAGLAMLIANRHDEQSAVRKTIREMSRWLLVPAGLGILMLIGLPWTAFFQFWFVMLMNAFGAPTSSLVMISVAIIGSWILFFLAIFGQIWRRTR